MRSTWCERDNVVMLALMASIHVLMTALDG